MRRRVCAVLVYALVVSVLTVSRPVVATADPGWGTVALLGTEDTGDAWNPHVALDLDGNAVAVWQQFDPTDVLFNAWASRFVPDAGWGISTRLETNDTGEVQRPQVAVDPAGNAVAVWDQSDGVRTNIWANRFVPGVGWGAAELIETTNLGPANFAQVAIDPAGNAVALWRQSDGVEYDIWANRFVPGIGWGNAILIETDVGVTADLPQVALDSSGNGIAVWREYDGTLYNASANRYVRDVGWGTPVPIETDDAGSVYNVQLAVDPSGNAVAVWDQYDGARNNVWANRYLPGLGWGAATLLDAEGVYNAYVPAVAVDAAGRAVATWRQFDGFRDDIWASRFVPGVGWGTAALIETNDDGSAGGVQVAVDPFGNAVAVWSQFDGVRNNVWANRYLPVAGWGTATLIETTGGDAGSPEVVLDPSGNAVAVWRQSDGIRWNVYANRYAVADTDGDGLTDIAEKNAYGTSSESADTDGDGLTDGQEVAESFTIPLNPDSDDDGLLDGEEFFTANTDPRDSDSDDGGAPDGWEVWNRLDPLAAADEFTDADGDGSVNLAEYTRGTDPWDADTDDDGTSDSVDAFPLHAGESRDTDGDGIGDHEDWDDDADGWADVVEFTVRTDPLDPASGPVDGNANGVPDVLELPAPLAVDLDGDGTPDGADDDVDGDGVSNAADACPRNAGDAIDTDGDRFCDNADEDDDNDGVFDAQDLYPLDADRTDRVGGSATLAPDGSGTILSIAVGLLAVIVALLALLLMSSRRGREGPR